MRPSVAASLAALTVLASASVANAQPIGVETTVGEGGERGYDMEWVGNGRPSTTVTFTWDTERCAESDGVEGVIGCDYSLIVKKAGKTVYDFDGDGDEDGWPEAFLGDASSAFDEDEPTYSVEYGRDWTCRRSGRYTWKVTVALSDPDGRARSSSRTGSFRIPKCRARKTRKVSASHAASTVNDDAEEAYEGEFVSQIRCGSGRRSRFRCQIVHNNNYRICQRTASVRFYRTNQFGRKSNDATVHYGKGRCRSF